MIFNMVGGAAKKDVVLSSGMYYRVGSAATYATPSNNYILFYLPGTYYVTAYVAGLPLAFTASGNVSITSQVSKDTMNYAVVEVTGTGQGNKLSFGNSSAPSGTVSLYGFASCCGPSEIDPNSPNNDASTMIYLLGHSAYQVNMAIE